jgi:O-antigen/teichoic acid export membrane protein
MKEVKNIINIGLGDIIGSGVSALFWFYLATLVNPNIYGELHYFMSIVSIVSYFALIGSQNTITVFVAKKIPIQSTFNFISLVIGIVGFILLYIIFQRIDLGFLIFGYIINNLAIGVLLGKQEYKKYFKYVITQKILTPILGLGLFYIFDIQGVIYGLALSYTFYLFVIIKDFKKVKINFMLFHTRKKFIVYNYFIVLSGTAHGQIDKILVMPILGTVILGNYSLALQIITLMMIFSAIFYKYMLSRQSAGFKVEKIKKILIFSSIIIAFVGYFIVPEILPNIFPKYTEAIDPIKIMSFSIIPMGLVRVYQSKFLAMEESGYVLIPLVISLSFLIPAMIVTGTIYGIVGIASSFLVSISIQAFCFYYIDKKIIRGRKIE